jgi:hypothetical protein
MKKLVTSIVLTLSLFLTPTANASGVRDQVRNAAEQHCQSTSCVNWVMRTVSAESCFKPNTTHRNRNGTIDQGIAQINNRDRPMKHVAVNVWNVNSSIHYMAIAYGRGLSGRWYGKSTPKGCGY